MNVPDICSPPVSQAFHLLHCQNSKETKIQVCGSEFLIKKNSVITFTQERIVFLSVLSELQQVQLIK